ncbi:MAG: phosphatase PAP2 family protein [Verrucomicrobiota bacterium]
MNRFAQSSQVGILNRLKSPKWIPDLRLKRDLFWGFRVTWKFLKRHKVKSVTSLILVVSTVVFATFPNDLAWFKAIRGDQSQELREVAMAIGHTGSLAQYNFAIIFGLWMVGLVRKSRYIQRLAVMVFVSTVLAGLVCNVFRFSLGRPRPFTNVDPAQFQGPQFQARYHGFPSGHTSTAFGTAVPVVSAMPTVGVPVLLYAGTMGWARMYDKAHYPSDVLVGAYLGTIFGLAGGLPLARSGRRAKRLRRFSQASA